MSAEAFAHWPRRVSGSTVVAHDSPVVSVLDVKMAPFADSPVRLRGLWEGEEERWTLGKFILPPTR